MNLQHFVLFIAFSSVCSANADLKLHLQLNESAGTVATDASGNGHNGTYVNSPALGKTARRGFGTEFNLNDTNDYLSIPHAVLDGTDTVCFAWWMKTSKTGQQSVLSGSNASKSNECLIFFYNSKTFRPYIKEADKSYTIEDVADGKWRHFVYQHTLSTGLEQLYINAELIVDSSRSTQPSGFDLDTGGLIVAQEQDSVGGGFNSTQAFEGTLDDLVIHTRILTGAEIAGLYGQVGHWKLDETAGTTATDSSLVSNDGTQTNGATPGAAGPGVTDGVAASFDGVDDRITVSSDTAYDVTDAITVSAWVNFDQAIADQTGQQSLVSRFSWSQKKGFQLFTDQPSSNSIRFRLLNGSWKDAVWMNPDIEAGGWRHVVGTYDGATIRLYVDGELKDTENQTNALDPHTGADLSLGANLDGRLADVRIYSRALDATEVAEMNGLIAHWKLDESSGINAVDSSAYGHDATLAGTQSWTTGEDGGGHASDYTDGIDDYFTAPSTTVMNDVQEGSYTLMAYFRPTNIPPGAGSENDSRYAVLMKQGWDLGVFYSGSGRFQFDHWLTGPSAVTTQSPVYAPATFYHLAAVLDRDAGEARLYVDGFLQDTETFTPSSAAYEYGTVPWRLGIGSPGASTWRKHANGVIDDARIYGRALSADEIFQYAAISLIGHWKLTESSGTTAVDSGPNGADGTYESGVALDQGGPYPGVTAPVFDGVNDHVELPAISAKFQTGLTIAAWIQPDATLGSGQFHEILDLNNGSQVDQILMTYNGAAGLQLFLTDTVDGSSIRTIEDNTGFTAGRWVHCVATIDSSGYGKIYRNGKVTKSGFFMSLPASVSRSTATIGKSAFGDHFGGGLQDVRLYNYELTAGEIHEIYGLVGHWNFDEGSGTTTADSTDNGNDASFDNGTPTWIDGVRGSALDFDGTSDVATDADFDPPAVGTVAFWFRSNATPTSGERLLGLGGDWEVISGSHRRLACNFTNVSTGDFKTADGIMEADRWRHLVAAYDSDADAFELYLDGALVASGPRPMTAQSAAILAFGTRHGSTQRFNGALDDIRVYNRWLSTTEIAELYGLVGWWRMEEGSGTTVADSSGAGNHGAFVNASGWSTNAKEGSGSIDLDGTNHVEIPSLILSEGSGTVAGWARLTNNDSYGSELISLGNHFGIRIDSTRSGQGSYGYTYNGSSWNDVKPNIYHEGGGWHHFALVANDQDLTREFYIDGVLQETITASGPLVMSGQDSSTLIGSKGSNYDFTGQLDDVRVYNRAIDPTEVRALYYGEYVAGLRIVKWIEVPNP